MRWLLALLTCASLSAEIVPIDCIEQAEPALRCADRFTLVIFDVDLVLIMPSDPHFQPANFTKYKKLLNKLSKHLTPEERFLAKNTIIQTVGATLVQEEMPCVISDLQERKVPVIALTGALSGTCHDCSDLQWDRYYSLHQFGIDFSSTYPWIGELEFTQLPGHAKRHPIYSHGILYANGKEASKGEVLAAFFDETHLRPLKVIFFDDQLFNLESVGKMLKKRHIEYTGFHYKRASLTPSEPVDPDCLKAKWKALIEKAKAHDQCCQDRNP